MTLYEGLSLALSSAGTIGLIITLLYVKTQMMALRDEQRLDASATLMSQVTSLSGHFMEYPELRPFFYEDEATPPPVADLDWAAHMRLNTLAELTLDTLETVLELEGADSAVVRESAVSWRAYLASSFRNSAYLTEYALRRADWYSADLVAVALSADERRRSHLAGPSVL